MAIKEVSKGVYTISVDVPDAKTSRGTGYATLVSDLRWKLWEEVQKTKLAEMQFEQESYIASQKSIADQIKQQRQLMADLESGQLTAQDAMNKANAGFNVSLQSAQMRAQAAGAPRTSTTFRDEVSQQRLPDKEREALKQIQQNAANVAAQIDDAGERQRVYLAAVEKGIRARLGVAGGVTPGFEDLFRRDGVAMAMDKVRSDLRNIGATPEQLERSDSAVLNNFSSDLSTSYNTPPARTTSQSTTVSQSAPANITRGAAPTASISERKDERERLALELEELKKEAASLNRPSSDLLQRTREGYGEKIGTGGAFGLVNRPNRELNFFDESRAVKDAKDMMDYFIADEVRNAQVKAEAAGTTLTDIELQEARRRGINSVLGSALWDLDRGPTNQPFLTGKRSITIPERPRISTGGDVNIAEGQIIDRPLEDQWNELTLEEIQELQEQGINAPAPGAMPPTSGLPFDFPASVPTSTSAPFVEEPIQDVAADLQFEREYGAQKGVKDSLGVMPKDERRRTKEKMMYDRIGREIKSVPPEPFKTQLTDKQRMANYQSAIVRTGAKLAAQQKKIERLTKPNLPDDKRKDKVPEYVFVVENLYETNKQAGAEPVKATYDELNRVYKDQPDIRKKAQEFLIALDILEGKVLNPIK